MYRANNTLANLGSSGPYVMIIVSWISYIWWLTQMCVH